MYYYKYITKNVYTLSVVSSIGTSSSISKHFGQPGLIIIRGYGCKTEQINGTVTKIKRGKNMKMKGGTDRNVKRGADIRIKCGMNIRMKRGTQNCIMKCTWFLSCLVQLKVSLKNDNACQISFC